MGGRSATYFAAQHPERVAALVLVDWSPENAPAGSRRVAQTVANTPEVFEDLDAVMRFFGEDPDSPGGLDRRPRFAAYTRPVPGGVAIKRDPFFQQQFRRQLATGEKAKQGVDLWQAVADVRAPTLVLRGSRSDLFAAETLPWLLEKNPRFRAV
jgi:pimeloyl-ACP methyl ester carboxylesterase